MSIHFITTPVEVTYAEPPRFNLKPPCPVAFSWSGTAYHISELLQEWRKDDSPRLSSRLKRSGVNKIYYQVRVSNGRVFTLYFDPTQRHENRQRGLWILLCEHLP